MNVLLCLLSRFRRYSRRLLKCFDCSDGLCFGAWIVGISMELLALPMRVGDVGVFFRWSDLQCQSGVQRKYDKFTHKSAYVIFM